MDARDRDVAAGVKRRGKIVERDAPQGAPGPRRRRAGRGRRFAGAATRRGDRGDVAEEDHARQQRMFLRDLVTRLLYRKQWRDFHRRWTTNSGVSKKVKEPRTCPRCCGRWTAGCRHVDASRTPPYLAAAKTYWGGWRGEEGERADEGLVEGRKASPARTRWRIPSKSSRAS